MWKIYCVAKMKWKATSVVLSNQLSRDKWYFDDEALSERLF